MNSIYLIFYIKKSDLKTFNTYFKKFQYEVNQSKYIYDDEDRDNAHFQSSILLIKLGEFNKAESIIKNLSNEYKTSITSNYNLNRITIEKLNYLFENECNYI